MSFFRTEQTEFTDQDCLVGGLKDMGLENKIEVLNAPRRLTGYGQGMAEIVVKKGAVGNHYELGFAKGKDGAYKLVSADDDKFDLKMLKRAYSERKAMNLAKAKGMKFVRKESKTVNGKVNTKLIFQPAGSR